LTENLLSELKTRLSRGLFPANLDAVIALTEEHAWHTDRPLGLFVLGRVLRLIERRWEADDEQSGPPDSEYQRMLEELMPALMAFLDAGAQTDAALEFERINSLVRAFLAWEANSS
jgi:hypothetical protein